MLLIARNFSFIKKLYTTYLKNNQFVQLKMELNGYRDALYGGGKSAKSLMTKKDIKMSNKIANAMKRLEKVIDNSHEKIDARAIREYVNKYPIIEGQVIHINSCLDNDISGTYIYYSA
ncbi:hypothetical protein RGR07_08690 [Staphylococcus epidermidis]|nr:hypothetical protein [Staphylococcus epidermidis]MCO6211767.1 hypothetical protein [Staphylococcus epidermidis]